MKSNNRAIGVFDSGVGGLTVASSIKKLLPNEEIFYLGDLLHLPYGSKSKNAVLSFTMAAFNFLIKQDIKLLVIACNTATSIAKELIEREASIPVIGVIYPGALTACRTTKNRRVGVIGTQRTVKANAYFESIRRIDPDISVFQKATPLLVPLIEEGWVNHPVMSLVLEEYFKAFEKRDIDTIVLGCTHYPLIKRQIKNSLKGVNVVDSAGSTAIAVRDVLIKEDILNRENVDNGYRIFLTDYADNFMALGEKILKRKLSDVNVIELRYSKGDISYTVA